MEKVLPYVGLVALMLSAIVFCMDRFRTRRTADKERDDETRMVKVEAFIEFLKTYMLKSAVLDFHSPEPQHKRTDSIIERLVEDKELKPEEIDALADRIKDEAKHADDKAKRMKAILTLGLLSELLDGRSLRKPTRVLMELE